MRFDDHRGLQPKASRLAGGSLRGTLARTKTSGAGKKVEELYLHIDANAWLGQRDWLLVGYALWQYIGSARDSFRVLPFSDMSGGHSC